MSPDELQQMLRQAGACAFGFAPLEEVAPEVMARYEEWLRRGDNGAMGYLANHIEIRRNPALLLDEGKNPRPGGTVISIAFPYFSGNPYRNGKLRIARYALGDDYHEVLRKRLGPVADRIRGETGREARICVDTAPILERYWAMEAGVGFIGRSRQLIVPGYGPWVFLAEIVTRATFPRTTNAAMPSCPPGCDACLKACPSRSLTQGGFNARICHSYLTIEHRGDFPDGFRPRPDCLYGCDLCAAACPLGKVANTSLEEFLPRESLLNLTAEDITSMSPETFSLIFRHSPVKRAKLPGLKRNAEALLTNTPTKLSNHYD